MKRILSLVLVLVMLLGMMPMTVLASGSEENPWSGRSAVFVGDSITAGSGTTKIYYRFLEEALGFGSVTAMGVGGSCISAASDYGTGNQPLIKRYQNIPSADLIVIFMGTNDYGHETPLGTVEDTNDGTFFGALNTIIPALVAKHTASKIVFVTPLHRFGFGTSKILGTQFTFDNIPNGVGAALGDYVDALKTVCASNGVSVIDLHTECTLDPSDAEVRAAYMPDGLHPNAAGHEVVAGIMESHLRTFEPAEAPETETDPTESTEPTVQTELIYGNRFASGFSQQNRASSRINYYLKAGTVIILKNPATFQWACARSSDENSSSNLGYFPEGGWSDKDTAVVAEDGWVGFAFKYRDETQSFDLTKPLSDYITIEEPHVHSYEVTVTAPTCTEAGYTTYTCECGESYVADYVDATGHTYEKGICTGCGKAAEGAIWTTVNNGQVTGIFASLQEAVNSCENGDTIVLTENCVVNSGATIDKKITIDGGNHLVDISGCGNAFITVAEGAEVMIRDLQLDGGASGFEVDYDAVTYTNYTIPLVSGSLDNDPKASQSAIISSGKLVCENVDISNRYAASVGGAMRILAGSVRLTDCDFTHNYGTSKGGALYIGSNFGTRTEYPVERVTITGCAFTENYTGHGGAIYAYNVEEIEITDSEFLNNTANGGKGGAIDLFSETTKPTAAMSLGLDFIQTTIRGCSFRGNWAGNDGFAIQSYDSDLYVYNSEFIENVGVHPTSSVGTISIEAYRHADESYRIYTLLDGCLFESNEGPCAVYGDHSSISDLDVTGCVFKNNRGNDSFLLYSATSHITDCQFIGETMEMCVIDARIYENYTIPPLLILTDITFTDCDTPAEILTRKQNHNLELNTYQVILEGITNGDITIWDGNAVTVNGTHTGNIQFGYDSERACLTVGSNAAVNGIIFTQPTDAEAKLGERYCVTVEAEGENLKYQWYLRNAGAKSFSKSSVKDNTYDDVMTAARAGREVYCVITDVNGNSVKTDTVKLVLLPSEELAITKQPTDGEAALGERYCVTVEAKGEGLKYQWYFRNKGATRWTKSTVRDNTYDDVMNNTRDGREVYCVITDLAGNKVTTDIVKLVRVPMKLEITSQPTDATAVFGEMFCAAVAAKGEGLKYQWYYRNAGSTKWYKSGVRDNTYDDVMTKARNGREVYCVITDKYGNSVTTETVKLIAVPSVELKLLGVTYEAAAHGERYCVSVEADGEGLTYTWYFRNAGATRWSKSGVRDNTYDDVMNKTRANREVYCVITDAFGNQIITDPVTLTVSK